MASTAALTLAWYAAASTVVRVARRCAPHSSKKDEEQHSVHDNRLDEASAWLLVREVESSDGHQSPTQQPDGDQQPDERRREHHPPTDIVELVGKFAIGVSI